MRPPVKPAAATAPAGNDDPTVVLPRKGRRRIPVIVMAGGGLAVLALLGGGAYVLWPEAAVEALPAVQAALPKPAAPPTGRALSLPVETEAQLNADQPDRLNIFRFASNQAVVVLDFASLASQGEMLNRIAAFVEKDGLPHDHLLGDAALTDAIRASGATPETYYYGHDYRAADIARFFRIADRDHMPLNADEEWLRLLVRRLGWLTPDAVGALITLPRLGADRVVDAEARRTILHHELSHGEYFTNPAYADYTAAFWHNVLTPAERALFRRFLAQDGYDPGIEDLMMNEMQAYLMHTRDPRFFSAANLGLSQERLTELQARFLLDMPRGWLRDCTPPPGVIAVGDVK